VQNFIDPWALFNQYYNEAVANAVDPCPATLATVNQIGQPSARIILIRHFDAQGLVFYTNIQSRKGEELKDNPKAALCFYWQAINRQIRIEGTIETIPAKETDLYFASRPYGSQINALISKQSSSLASYEAFIEQHKATEKLLSQQKIVRPEYWVGLKLVPSYFEFWQDEKSRCHLRQSFTKLNNSWKMDLLYP